MLTYPVVLISRMDPLKGLFKKSAFTGRISRWLLLLFEFDIKYVISKSIKGRTIAKYLAKHAIDSEENRSFPNENIMEVTGDQWKLYFDGVVNIKG